MAAPRLGATRLRKRKHFMSDAMVSAIRKRALMDGMSTSAVVRAAVSAYLGLAPDER